MAKKPLCLEVLIDSNCLHDNIDKYGKNYEKLKQEIIDKCINEYLLVNFETIFEKLKEYGYYKFIQSINMDLVQMNLYIVNFNNIDSSNELLKQIPKFNGDGIEIIVQKIYNDITQNCLEDNLPCTFHTYLPSKQFIDIWENLLYEDDLKVELLNFIYATIKLCQSDINKALLQINKLILLHGPPGTGKTTLCKALCQKVSIIMADFYENFQLIEINSHSLFSKWFSESGKLVLKLFDQIRELADDPANMIFILIDEIESLTYDRKRINNADPTDAIRVVNAILTQIDSIKNYSNIIILATSNLAKSMDNAFVDRADIIEFINFPSENIVYEIFRSSIKELNVSNTLNFDDDIILLSRDNPECENPLVTIARLCSKKLSGRAIRKLPFLTYAMNYVKYSNQNQSISMSDFLKDLEKMCKEQISNQKHFSENTSYE